MLRRAQTTLLLVRTHLHLYRECFDMLGCLGFGNDNFELVSHSKVCFSTSLHSACGVVVARQFVAKFMLL